MPGGENFPEGSLRLLKILQLEVPEIVKMMDLEGINPGGGGDGGGRPERMQKCQRNVCVWIEAEMTVTHESHGIQGANWN